MRLRLDSVWSRLLGTMALVVVPAALLIALLAYSLFGAAMENLRTSQVTAVAGRASTVRSWLDAAGRSLANEAFAVGYVGADRCALLADAFLKRNIGFSAVQFFDESATPCAAGIRIDASALPGEAADQAQDGADYRLQVVATKLWIVATLVSGPERRKTTCILVVDDDAMRKHLTSVAGVGGVHAALVDDHGRVLAVAHPAAKPDWLPASLTGLSPNSAWRASDAGGGAAAFALAPVEGSPLSVLMRFDDHMRDAARRRLVILCLAQLAMLGALALVYATAIRREVVQWIEGIDAAARARGRDPESRAKAPVTTKMPRELRSVAESFNDMIEHGIERQQALQSSLAENRALMLEMHHRIKNSLQVIQSYLALVRRAAARPEAVLLARIEARVGVLAVAYRLALTPNGMRPIAVKPFLDEICAAAIAGLRRPRQRAAYAIDWNGELLVDRAIPLGLGLVEALIAGFSSPDASYVGVRLSAENEGLVELKVESDAAPTEAGLPDKVMRGLASQLGAAASHDGGGEILVWRFTR